MSLIFETLPREISSCLAQFLGKRIYHVIQSWPQHRGFEVRNAKTLLLRLQDILIRYLWLTTNHLPKKSSNKFMEDWSWRFKGFFYMAENVFDDLDINVSASDKRQGDDLSAFDEQMLIFMKAMEKLPEVTETITCLLRELTDFMEGTEEFGKIYSILVKQQVANSELPKLPYQVRKLKGRAVEKAKILEALLRNAEGESKESPVLISITGPVGIGKTDLACSVYNSAQVEAEFDVRAWIYMDNDRQDNKWLTLQRSESASVDQPSQLRRFRGSSTVDIFKIIEKETDGKVLIVLDKLTRNQWIPDQHFLSRWCRTREGSAIIVTTRCEVVGRADAVSLNVELDGLEEEEYLELFKECALGYRNRDKYPELENICGGIAKRFGGNPLAAVKIGRLLKSQPDKDHWRIISRSNLGLIDPTGSIIISELRHSYEKLLGNHKQCYLACALFPKSYPFKKDQLYAIWNAIGCCPSIFDERLFNQFFVSWARKDGEFILHAIFHELADYICDGEFFRLEDEIKEEDDIQIPDKARHVYVTADNFVKVYRVLQEKTHLRSLVICGDLSSEQHKTNFMGLLEEVLRNLKGLRLLIISVLPTGKLPDAIGGLKHLRYLELPIDIIMEESIQELPTWLSDNPFVGLRHLQNLKELREAILKKGSIQDHPTWKSSDPSASILKEHAPSESSDTSAT